MSHRDASQSVVHFYATAPYPCSYLDGREARSQVAIPVEAIDAALYSQLVRMGFRRSGYYTYRPFCEGCEACVPVRLRAAQFAPDRTQRRIWRRHQGLAVRVLPLAFDTRHFELYRRYQRARHPGGGMSEDGSQQYSEFILKSRVDSVLVEFSEGDVVRMVSLVDRLEDGLSAVYTFYDPDVPGASYGNYSVMWQARWAREMGLPFLYLGYWIGECRKMVYKSRFKPLERLADGAWAPF